MQQFEDAFNHAMLYEVGKFWNPNDPDVIQGRIDTKEQRRKVGYVNIPQDRGGETKYGIAQTRNPTINVRFLNLDGCKDVYERLYWRPSYSDRLSPVLAIAHFDACVNHGVARGCRFLQRAAGVTEDGVIGRMTLNAIAARGDEQMLRRLFEIRKVFYHDLVARSPSQSVFIKGWMNRITEVTEYSLNKLV